MRPSGEARKIEAAAAHQSSAVQAVAPLATELRDALARLPADQRVALILSYHGFQADEIVGMINALCAGTVRSRAGRGRQRMREMLS